MNDIDLSDGDGNPSEWIPIGQYTDKTPDGYAGSFDGGGFTVKGYIVVSANVVSADNIVGIAAGLFGLAGQSADIRGLTVGGVVSVDISGETVFIHAGGIAGLNKGTITDCANGGGDVSASGSESEGNAGGIAGYNNGTITNSTHSGGKVSASGTSHNYAGGIAGQNYGSGKINNNVHSGGVSASGSAINRAGGIAGYNNNGTITNNTHSGGVSASSDNANNTSNYAGGIAGENNGGTITNNVNSNGVSAFGGNSSHNSAGGIAGLSNGGKITNCAHSSGAVTASGSSDSYTGGIAGYNIKNRVNISNSYWPVGDLEAVGSGDKGMDAVSADVVSLDTAEMQMAVTTVLPAKRPLSVALRGSAPALISYPGTADNMKDYLSVSGDISVASPELIDISRDWPCDVSGKKTGVTEVSFDINLRATDFSSLKNGPKPITASCAAAPLAFSVVSGIPAAGISLDITELKLTVGEKQRLKASVQPVDATDEIIWKSTSPDIAMVDNTGIVTAVKRGEATITATAGSVTASCDLTVLQKIESTDVTLSPDVFVYDGNKKEPEVTVKAGGETLTKDIDYTAEYTNNTDAGEATVTVTGIGFCVGTVSKNFKILRPASPDVTDKTRTDVDGSGVLVIEPNTTEGFAIYDALGRLRDDNKTLPDNISADAQAVQPTSANISTDITPADRDRVREAIGRYWNLAPTSPDRVRIVSVLDTVAKDKAPEAPKTVWGKIWAYISKGGNDNNDAKDFGGGDYLPLQTNFTITSADIAALPEGIREGLTEDNFLERISLFAAVTSGDSVSMEARALNDVASSDEYIMVTKDNDGSYKIKTRLLLFNREGKVTNGPGAPFVMAANVLSDDKRSTRDGNYFIVEDGKTDDRYQVTMAFAAKETNSASVSLTVSGDIEPLLVSWIISGDTEEHRGNASADIMGGEQSVSIINDMHGYHVTLSDGSQTLSPDIKTISADVDWGGEWNILAEFSKITANSVTLDQIAVVLPVGGSCTITATVEPRDAYGGVSWVSSSPDIAAISPIDDKNATITAAAAGTTTITAKAGAGDKSASCTVTVRKSADEGGGLRPLAPGTVMPNIGITDDGPVPVKPEYITDLAKQDEAMKKIGLAFDDAALMKKGELVISGGLVNKAADEVISNDTEIISKDAVIYLPLVESRAAEVGKTHALGFTVVSGDLFGEIDDISQIRVIKIFPDGTGRPFRVVTETEKIQDKSVALYDADDNIVTGAIEPETEYTLAVFIKDGGEYDLDGEEDGTVIDPIAIIRQSKPPVPKPTPHGGSSGGCTAGAGALALLTLIPLWMRRGKR